MQWSWPVASIPMPRQPEPVRVRVHLSLVLMIWVLVVATQASNRSLEIVALFVCLFSCILLHEFGHVVAAQFHDIRTRDVTLLPIGGVSHLERLPQRARDEILIALAGPAVSVALAGLALALDTIWPHALLEQVMWLNMVLGLFNLLPAFPMDGGRVLRGILWLRVDYVTATHRAALVGRAMAMLFMVVGLMYNGMLLLIGAFVMLAATAEEQYVGLRDRCARLPCRAASDDLWVAVRPHDALSDVAARLLLHGRAQAVVFHEGSAIGFLTAEDIARGKTLQVLDSMRPVATVQASAPLTEALELLADYGAVCVVENGQVTGVLTQRSLWRMLHLQSALDPRVQPPVADEGHMQVAHPTSLPRP